MMKSMQVMERTDFRRRRAEALTAALMQEIDDVLPDNVERQTIFERMLSLLYINGACWTTEEERVKLGFEPRDSLGWTPSDRVKAEQDRLNALHRLSAHVVSTS